MKRNEKGRSMIEMLGVLAIIGVLSVGGLAGYAKAMSKYRTNKSIDQITQIVASTRNLFAGHKDYSALGTGSETNKTCSLTEINAPLILKGHLVPDEMMVKETANNVTTLKSLENPFADTAVLSCGSKRSGDKKAFTIIYNGVPNDACIELATQDWGSGASSGLVAVCVNKSIADVYLGAQDSDECVTSKAMSVLKASAACTKNSTNLNTIYWKFY